MEATREELERRERSLLEEHRNTRSYLGLIRLLPDTPGNAELVRRVTGDLERLEGDLWAVREALDRVPPPAPTLS